jgi:membrane protein implicated in regulation of membrane protease activity
VVDSVFLACAVLGGGVFVVRTLLQFLGIGGDEADGAAGGAEHGDSDDGFRVLSLQGISAFCMMFGLVGLALIRQSGVAPSIALLVASGAGVATVWVIAKMFGAMARLQSSGNTNLYNAIGQEGQVYLTVQRGGEGKVQLVVQNRLSVYDARAEDGAELATGRRVRVVAVNGEVLVVQPVDKGWIEANLPEGQRGETT